MENSSEKHLHTSSIKTIRYIIGILAGCARAQSTEMT